MKLILPRIDMNIDGVVFTGRVHLAIPNLDEASQYIIQVFTALKTSHKIDTIFSAMRTELYPKFGELEFSLLETESGQEVDLETPFLFQDPTFSVVLCVDYAGPKHPTDFVIH
jgi:hypothetical protein